MNEEHNADCGAPSAEKDATCANCGRPIVQRYDGTFVPKEGPIPMAWYHDLGAGSEIVRWARACGWATPLPPADRSES